MLQLLTHQRTCILLSSSVPNFFLSSLPFLRFYSSLSPILLFFLPSFLTTSQPRPGDTYWVLYLVYAMKVLGIPNNFLFVLLLSVACYATQHSALSVRWSIHPSVHWSMHPSVHWSIRHTLLFFSRPFLIEASRKEIHSIVTRLI